MRPTSFQELRELLGKRSRSSKPDLHPFDYIFRVHYHGHKYYVTALLIWRYLIKTKQ
jgi:hypothetical protein